MLDPDEEINKIGTRRPATENKEKQAGPIDPDEEINKIETRRPATENKE
jgi:hypothetical protein